MPRWGRGRVDTFNPYKAIQFNWDLSKLPADELIGAVGLSVALEPEAARRACICTGTATTIRSTSATSARRSAPASRRSPSTTPRLKRVRDWIWTLPPPKYPYAVDQALAARGAPLYQQHCADCHADQRFRDGVKSGARVGQVEPIAAIGTDRHRLDSYTVTFAANQYGLYPDSPYRFTHFRKTNGYANHPLDGIWLRGPYLHNGSVPTLRDLLDPPEQRPDGASTAATTCSIRPRSASCRTCRRLTAQIVQPLRHDRAGQQQRRPRLRHDAVRR